MPSERGNNGRFIRTREPWSPESWNDGYHDNKGRFRVYRPDYPNAYNGGYTLRAHVVWWLECGDSHPSGTNLHHINGIKDDDRFDNLKLMEHGEHTRKHNQKQGVEHICKYCEKIFRVPGWRVRQREREGNKIKYCSLVCYYAQPKSIKTKRKQSIGLKRAYREGRR